MRIYKDLEMVEHLGSGIPRILEFYNKSCFIFTDNFLRMKFLAVEPVTDQVKRLIKSMGTESMSTLDLLETLSLNHRPTLRENYLNPALNAGYVIMTIPNKPNSRMQKYKLTVLGRKLKNELAKS